MYLKKAIAIAQKMRLPYEVKPEGNAYSDGKPCVIVRSNPTPHHDLMVIVESGLYAVGSEQGNYAGGIEGRLHDPALPVRLYMVARAKELEQFLWELQSDLLMQPLKPVG